MAISFTPGQVISWDDLNAMMAQHGSPGGAKSVDPVAVKPLTKAESDAILDAGGDPDAEAARRKSLQSFRYYFEDGSYVEAQETESASRDAAGASRGPFRVVEYHPSASYTAQNPAATTARTGQTTTIEGTQRPDGTYDNEQPREVVRDATGRLVSSKPLEGQALKDWREDRERSRNPGGKTDAQLEAERKDAEARAARPGTKIAERTEVRDGKTITVETWRLPDGSTEERTAEAPVKPIAGQVVKGGGPNGEDVQAITDPATGQVRYEPIPGAASTAIPGLEGMPNLDLADAERAQQSYMQAYQWAVEQIRTGKLTPAQVERIKAVLEPARQAAESLMTQRQREITNAQTTRGQDISARGQDASDVASRRSLANSLMSNAFTTVNSAAGKLLPGNGDTAVQGLLSMLSIQDAYIKAHGLMSPLSPVPGAQQAGLLQPGGLPGNPAQAAAAQNQAQAQAAVANAAGAPNPHSTSSGQAQGGIVVNIGGVPQPTINADGSQSSPVSGQPYTPGGPNVGGIGDWFTPNPAPVDPVFRPAPPVTLPSNEASPTPDAAALFGPGSLMAPQAPPLHEALGQLQQNGTLDDLTAITGFSMQDLPGLLTSG